MVRQQQASAAAEARIWLAGCTVQRGGSRSIGTSWTTWWEAGGGGIGVRRLGGPQGGTGWATGWPWGSSWKEGSWRPDYSSSSRGGGRGRRGRGGGRGMRGRGRGGGWGSSSRALRLLGGREVRPASMPVATMLPLPLPPPLLTPRPQPSPPHPHLLRSMRGGALCVPQGLDLDPAICLNPDPILVGGTA